MRSRALASRKRDCNWLICRLPMKSLLRIVGVVIVLNAFTVARSSTHAVRLSDADESISQLSMARCHGVQSTSVESGRRQECSDSGHDFQRIILSPKVLIADFGNYGFRHPENIDMSKLAQLGANLNIVWSKDEKTVIGVDFSELGTFNGSDRDDFVLRAGVFWRALAQYYASRPSVGRSHGLISFEILRPPDTKDRYRWSGIQAILAASIKEVAPEQTVWQTTDGTITMMSDPPKFNLNLDRLQKGINLGRYTGENDGSDLEWPKNPAVATESSENQKALDSLLRNFDHARLVITPSVFINEAAHSLDLKFNKEKLKKLDSVLESIWKRDRATIITIDAPDTAFVEGSGTQKLDSDAFVKSLEDLWRDLSQHCVSLYDSFHLGPKSTERVFFEVLNEPQESDPHRWWGIQNEIIRDGIRQGATGSAVIAVGNGGSIDGLLSLVPLKEPNVIYSFHYYDPYEFTQQGADWVSDPTRHFSGLKYPSDPNDVMDRMQPLPKFEAQDGFYHLRYGLSHWNREFIAGEIDYAHAWATSQQMNVICDEFGVNKQKGADSQSRVRWITDVREALNKNHIPWTFWDYNSDTFGATDTKDGSGLNRDVMRALF